MRYFLLLLLGIFLLISSCEAQPPANMESGLYELFLTRTLDTDDIAVNYMSAFMSTPEVVLGITAMNIPINQLVLDYKIEAVSQSSSGFSIRYTLSASTGVQIMKAMYFSWMPTDFTLSLGSPHGIFYKNSLSTMYSSPISDTTGSMRTVEITTVINGQFNPYQNSKVLLFTRGVKATSTGYYQIIFSVKATQGATSRAIGFDVSISNDVLLQSSENDFFCFDELGLYFDAEINYQIHQVTFNSPTPSIPQFDNSDTVFFMGLSNIRMLDDGSGNPWEFNFVNDPIQQVIFQSYYQRNTMYFLGFKSRACDDAVKDYSGSCFTERNGCTGFKRVQWKFAKIIKMKLNAGDNYLLLLQPNELILYKYSTSSSDYEVDQSVTSMQMADIYQDFDVSRDFSRLVLCGTSTLRGYGWNGTAYVPLFSYQMATLEAAAPYTFTKVDMTEDGETIIASGPEVNGQAHLIFLKFNSALNKYEQTLDLPYQPVGFKHIQEYNMVVALDSTGLFLLTLKDYDGSGNFVKESSVQYTASAINVAEFSGDSMTMGLYIDNNLAQSLEFPAMFYILQFNEATSSMELFTSIIIPYLVRKTPSFKFSYDGTVLIVQANNQYKNYRMLYRRNNINEQFVLEELFQETLSSYIFEKEAVEISDDGNIIIAADEEELNLYYCQSDIIATTIIPPIIFLGPTQSQSSTETSVTTSQAAPNSNNSSLLEALLAFDIIILILLIALSVFFVCVFKKIQKMDETSQNNATLNHNTIGEKDNFMIHPSSFKNGTENMIRNENIEEMSENNSKQEMKVLRKKRRRKEKQVDQTNEKVDVLDLE